MLPRYKPRSVADCLLLSPTYKTSLPQQATLIIRHPDDGKLYVNFDQEILQLIREAKILDRMGIEIPESAKIALFQVNEVEGSGVGIWLAVSERYPRLTKYSLA